MKNFKEESFVEDFSTLPMSIISYSDDPDEQLQTLNSLILECIERHAPLKRKRVTGPPVPWMKCPNIKDLQKERDTARYEAHNTPFDTKWDYFRSVRNKLKAAIRTARKAFIEKALYSSKSSEVRKVIHRILMPSPKPLRFNLDELNDHFASTAQRTLNVNATPTFSWMNWSYSIPHFSCYLRRGIQNDLNLKVRLFHGSWSDSNYIHKASGWPLSGPPY